MNKKTIFTIIKAAVSISLLTYIIITINWNEVANNLSNANFLLLSVALLLYVLEQVELTYKWNILIGAEDLKFPYSG